MRTIIFVACGFLLLLAFSFGTYRYVVASTEQLTGQIQQVASSVESQQWDKSREQLSAAQTNWNKTKNWWAILLDHQEIDNIDISMEKTEKYIESKGMSLALGELSALQMLVEHIAEKEAPTIKNILQLPGGKGLFAYHAVLHN